MGLSTLALPTAADAASVAPSGGPTSTTVPAAASLLFHLDANSYSPGLGVGWNDLSGLGNHGTIGSGVTHVAAAESTPAHFSFNGVNANSVVSIKGGVVITGATPTAYTKMIWFRRDTVARTDNLISSASPSGQSQHFLYFVADPGAYRLLTAGNGNQFARILSDFQTSANEWLFGAVRFSTTSGFSLYVNTNVTSWSGTPSLITSTPYNASNDALSAGGLGFNIGQWQSGNSLQGDVATALAYDVDIGDADVKSYFASTVSRFYPA